MGLSTYRKKRDFGRTPEPAGKETPRRRSGRIYLVQKHAASRLHHDFRLELDGVLKSWAVPKGPPRRPGEKVLAMQTEDHPLEYADFEGVIPAGEYGGGTVMLWDRGTWEPEGDAAAGLRRGELTFSVHGQRLQGRWSLVRMRGGKSGRGRRTGREWLLIKRSDETPAAIEREDPERSVASGRTMDEIAAAADRVWTGEGEEEVERAATDTEHRAARPETDTVAGVRLSHPDRVLYPELGLTKRELAEYYATVADHLLPHVVGRPLTLVRCPRGHQEKCFYQKHATLSLPAPVRGIEVEERDGKALYVAVDDLPGVVTLVQFGALELHPWGSRGDRLDRPDRIVLDIDPGEGVAFAEVVATALALRERLDGLGLRSFPRTTGGKGLHVVVPIERRSTWDEVKEFAHDLVLAFARALPDRYLTTASKAQRRGRIFLDYLRNDHGATAVASYSSRARDGAPVATPLTWDEVTQRLDPAAHTVRSVPRRLASLRRDPWEGFFTLRQSLTKAMREEAARAR